jgi:ATP-dependent Lon protease
VDPNDWLEETAGNRLLPILPLRDVCLFPGASLTLVVSRPAAIAAVQMAGRAGGRLLALAQRDPATPSPVARDLHAVGTVAALAEELVVSPGELRVELDGLRRARAATILGVDLLVAEAEPIEEDDAGGDWGAAVEALARYLHAHPDLRSFLEARRRAGDPMSWVNLACQHLPIAASARQRLLEARAAERCLRIGRGLDALLRKEQTV